MNSDAQPAFPQLDVTCCQWPLLLFLLLVILYAFPPFSSPLCFLSRIPFHICPHASSHTQQVNVTKSEHWQSEHWYGYLKCVQLKVDESKSQFKQLEIHWLTAIIY